MSDDLFDFWQKIEPRQNIHPADESILKRVDHSFQLDTLPCPILGPLKTSLVVLLFLSPGFEENDRVEAKNEAGQSRYAEMREGNQLLPAPEDSEGDWKWWHRRTALFGDWRELRDKIAILNIGAYKSKTFEDIPLLAALPSSRVSLNWAQTVLFPQAEEGSRVVVCLRSARFWGLSAGKKYGKGLFAPKVNRSGHMNKNCSLREDIISTVRAHLDRPGNPSSYCP